MSEKTSKTIKLTLDNFIDTRRIADDKAEVVTTIEVVKTLIPNKLAALEVYRELTTINIFGFGMIVSVFVTAVMGAFHVYAGAIAAGIFSVLGAYVLVKNKKKMKYFQDNYDIKPKGLSLQD